MRYAWLGLAADGRPRRGTLIATDAAAARRALRATRIIAVRIEARGRAPAPRLRKQEVTQFSRQLGALLQAGLPLLQALDVLAGYHARPGMKRVLQRVGTDVTGGMQLSTALARFPKYFGTLYCQLLHVGEISGTLPAMLTRLADQRERSAAQQSRLRSALAYPVCVLTLACAIATALMIFVVPTFQHIFDSVGAPLPAPTRIVLAVSALAGHAALPLVMAMLSAGLILRWRYRRHAGTRLRIDRMLLRLPVVGGLLTLAAVARWSRALATLLQAGASLADTFDALAQTTGNQVFHLATHELARTVRQGSRLAQALRTTPCFPGELAQVVAIGEESGALDTMLADLADLYERQLDSRIAGLSNLAEPLMVVVLGVLIGGLVIAMYLPIMQLGNAI
jgi:type IV pilus assembly protein PilC